MIRPVRALSRILILAAAGGCAITSLAAAAPSSPKPLARPGGTVISASSLKRKLWIPGTTAHAYRLTYVTSNSAGKSALSTGEVFIPKGKAPAGGWPVISWAHGTSGLSERCMPSVIGPAEPARDFRYLANWMKHGYAVVATDYAALGHPMAYLNGRSEAHNVVDMVKAGRAFAADHLLSDQQLSNRWVVIGQSQGGGSAIYTARYATHFGGPALDYLGAVGTGVPAYIEEDASLLGPGVPGALTPIVNMELTYIVAALRDQLPQLGIDKVLTPYGRKYVADAEHLCTFTGMTAAMKGVIVGTYFTKPLASLPNWTKTIDKYMQMPTTGFDKPFFMGHGLYDTDVPYDLTAKYVATLKANHQPVTFKTYLADHSGTLVQAQADEIPFVANLFHHTGRKPFGLSPYTRLELAFTARRPATPTGFTFLSQLPAPPAGYGSPALRSNEFRFPRGTRLNLGAVPACAATDSDFAQQETGACPPNTRVGTGSAEVKLGTGSELALNVTAFNATGRGLTIILTSPSGGVVRVLHPTVVGDTVRTTLPRVSLGLGQEASLTRFALQLDGGTSRRPLIRTPAKCPASGHWTLTYISHYDAPLGTGTFYRNTRCSN